MDIPKPYRSRYLDKRSASFFDGIMRELNYVQGQSVLLYQFSGEFSGDSDDIYKEQKFKKYEDPILLACTVNIDPTMTDNTEGFGDEDIMGLQISVQITELHHLSEKHERKIYPAKGDIVIFKQRIFEIANVDDSRMYLGSPEYPYNLRVECNKVRKSKLSIDLPKDFY